MDTARRFKQSRTRRPRIVVDPRCVEEAYRNAVPKTKSPVYVDMWEMTEKMEREIQGCIARMQTSS